MSKKNYVQVFANPEDIKGTPNKVDFASEDVERVRRCHLVRIQILGSSKSKNQKNDNFPIKLTYLSLHIEKLFTKGYTFII